MERVERGDFLGAFDEFYADDVVMQENGAAPTVGKAANTEREEGFFATVREIHENRAASVVVDGDRAVIHWQLEYTGADGNRYRLDQLAHQTWRGDRIAHERFFYDPASIPVAA